MNHASNAADYFIPEDIYIYRILIYGIQIPHKWNKIMFNIFIYMDRK